MNAQEIVKQLEALGSESYRKLIAKHGIAEPMFGVKIGDLKNIQKKVKKDYQLALDLYDTGVYDARYLAGMIADEKKMTKKDLRRWLKAANCDAVSEFIVAPVAAESAHGWELALEWIESDQERIATAGWNTLSGVVAITDDSELDVAALKKLLKRVEKTIHEQPNSVRYTMNGFVIAVGCYVPALTELAMETGEKIGKVEVDMGETACQVPSAPQYIKKVKERGTIGKKRKMVRC